MIDEVNLKKLEALNNEKVIEYVNDAIKLFKPDKVTVLTDSKEDIQYVKDLAIKNKEEYPLLKEGHTYHFDSPLDQGRDKAHTAYLLDEEVNWGIDINSIEKKKGLKELNEIMNGIMKGKEMLVAFFCLGPTGSKFSIPAMQITDSAYVVHSESILYRGGYEEFKNLKKEDDFFYLMHSAGELENGVCKNIDKRRIYIDLDENRVYTCNNQYAGNSVGLKKLCFRLAIQKATREGWLAEHMFLMGVHGKEGRTSYFAGAYPSACGKTSTSMISGQNIIGDDIVYIRNIEGIPRAVNVEKGIFGIIQDVNKKDDPYIYDALRTNKEVIFSNVLISDGEPYWLGMKEDIPKEGINYLGKWEDGMKEPFAHKNARYTLCIDELKNADKALEDKNGVKLDALVYGGRDSDTTVPVAESLSWNHGVLLSAIIESETTAATIGQEGIREHDPMAMLDFISVPMKEFIRNHMKFDIGLKSVPKAFTTNYFLKDENGEFFTSKLDKKVWILWADGRIHSEFGGIKTPIGIIPKYEDLKELFKIHMKREYTYEEYEKEFSIRVDKYLDKMQRMKEIFDNIEVTTKFQKEFDMQFDRLRKAKEEYGSVIAPKTLEEVMA